MRWDTDPDLVDHHKRCNRHVDRALRCSCERERAHDNRPWQQPSDAPQPPLGGSNEPG